MSDTGNTLMKLLKEIYNDRDFVCGSMTVAGTEENWQEMIDFINTARERNDEITSDDLAALAVALGRVNQAASIA